MSQLTDMPNLGPVVAGHLEEVGIDTPEKLCEVGSKEALLRIRATVDPGACLHELQGIEGAIQGVPKKELSPETKTDLKKFFNSLN